MSGSWDAGKRVAGAAALAVERINADKALLTGRWLDYSWADSGCSAQQGLVAMGKLLGAERRVDAVIGCSSACEVTSYLSGGQDIPQISHSCTASSLSNKEKHGLVRPLTVVFRMHHNLRDVSLALPCSSRAQWHLTRAKGRR